MNIALSIEDHKKLLTSYYNNDHHKNVHGPGPSSHTSHDQTSHSYYRPNSSLHKR
jgi:hypothetical protein